MEGKPQLPIILVGAPSGAGKTYFGRAITARQLAPFSELVDADVEVRRHDLKAIPNALADDKVYVIEVATQRMQRYAKTPYWRSLVAHLQDKRVIIHVTLDVKKSVIIRDYFFRIFTARRKSSGFLKALDVSPYLRQPLRLVRYLVTRDIADARVEWEKFGRSLSAQDKAGRVVFMRAVRVGTGYEISTEPEAKVSPVGA